MTFYRNKTAFSLPQKSNTSQTNKLVTPSHLNFGLWYDWDKSHKSNITPAFPLLLEQQDRKKVLFFLLPKWTCLKFDFNIMTTLTANSKCSWNKDKPLNTTKWIKYLKVASSQKKMSIPVAIRDTLWLLSFIVVRIKKMCPPVGASQGLKCKRDALVKTPGAIFCALSQERILSHLFGCLCPTLVGQGRTRPACLGPGRPPCPRCSGPRPRGGPRHPPRPRWSCWCRWTSPAVRHAGLVDVKSYYPFTPIRYWYIPTTSTVVKVINDWAIILKCFQHLALANNSRQWAGTFYLLGCLNYSGTSKVERNIDSNQNE